MVVRSGDAVTPTDQAAAAHAAGAAMLVVVNEGDGRLSDWYGEPDGRTTGQIPVASVTMDEGEALIKKIGAAGKKRVKLAVEAHASPSTCTTWPITTTAGCPRTPPPRRIPATSPGSTSTSARRRARRSSRERKD